MGQKVHPIGLRVGLYRKWKSNWFLDHTNYSNFLHLNFEINKYFAGILKNSPTKTFFSHCVIAKYSLEKIYIFVFFYRLRPSKRKKFKRIKNSKQFKFSSLSKNINLQNNHKLSNLINILKTIKFTTNVQTLTITKKDKKSNPKLINLSTNKFVIKRGTYKPIENIKLSMQDFLGTKIHITFINLLSFIKFYLYSQNNMQLIEGIERQLINFYKYDVKLLRDAINIFFITIILKQAQTLAKFIGYQLRRTPKNRSHGKLIQFYKKLGAMALAQQKEIIGLHIKFKGRISGRKRKRHTTIKIGELPLQSYRSNIEYGQSDGFTIYGAIGIKVWIYYRNEFNSELQKHFIKYLYNTAITK